MISECQMSTVFLHQCDYYPGSGKIAIFTRTYWNYDNYDTYDIHSNLRKLRYLRKVRMKLCENNDKIES